MVKTPYLIINKIESQPMIMLTVASTDATLI